MCNTCKTPSPGNWSLTASVTDEWPASALTAALESTDESMGVRGYLLTEGVPTGDRRLISHGALSWSLPVPLMRVVENRGGHDGQFTVGAITEMEREGDGRIRWAGRLFSSEAGMAARQEMKTRYTEGGLKYGLSADLDDAEVDVEFAESDDGLIEVKMQTLTSGRVRGATLCDVPAFSDAYAMLDEDEVDDVDDVEEEIDEDDVEDDVEDKVLVASAVRLAPASWYTNPRLSGPTALTVTPEGRIYGHIATWSQCHTGFPGMCVQAPRSRSDYAFFRTGAIYTLEGTEVHVGHLTMDTGHADARLSAKNTVAHYDNTGLIVADIAAGEDDYGIWVAGSVRDIGGDKIRELQAAAVSGDWREINGSLELVALLSVPVPGFPVPRAKALAASGSMKSLIATAGVLEAHVEETEVTPEQEAALTELVAETQESDQIAEETQAEAPVSEETSPEEDAENEGAPAQEEPAEEEAVTEEELPELLPAVESPVDVTDLLKNLDSLVGPDPRVLRQLEQLDKLAGA